MIDSAIKSTKGFLPNATPKTILQKKTVDKVRAKLFSKVPL